MWLLTVEVLDALDIIWVQLEVLNVAVHGVHQGLPHAGVVQPQRVPKLMGSHQEDAVTWEKVLTSTLSGTGHAGQGP